VTDEKPTPRPAAIELAGLALCFWLEAERKLGRLHPEVREEWERRMMRPMNQEKSSA